MTPKKAIIIVLIMFFIVAIIFVFLYINNKPVINPVSNQPAGNGNMSASSTSQEKLSPAEIEQQKDEATKKTVEKIIEQGKNEFGGTNVDAIKAAEAVANQRVQEKLNSRTPEQIEADNKREAEIQRMLEEANNKVKLIK